MYAVVFMVLRYPVDGRIIRSNIMLDHVMIWGMGLPLLITFFACVLICVMKRRSERKVQRRANTPQNKKTCTDSANGYYCVLVDVVAIYHFFNNMAILCHSRKAWVLSSFILEISHVSSLQQLSCQSIHIRP